MKQAKYVKNLSKYKMRLIANMKGIIVKTSTSKTELFRIFKKDDKITYKESPFKSIIQDIRYNLTKNGKKLIKKGLNYVKKMKELTESQANNIKEKIIKFKNELIRKNKINNRIEKDLNDYNSSAVYNGIKDIRYFFNEYEDEYEDNRYLFNENEDKITYKESPFKSIIVDIRNKRSKNGNKLIKKGLYCVEEMEKN